MITGFILLGHPRRTALLSKKDLSETEIRTRYITPAITQSAGWDVVQMREDRSITLGKIHVRGKSIRRGERRRGRRLDQYMGG